MQNDFIATSPAQPQDRSRKLKILVTGGHPGDPEYGCGGTIARFTASGHEAVLLYLNRGEAGIQNKTAAEAGAIRTTEAQQASKILNARAIFAGQMDGRSEVNFQRYEEYRGIIDQEQPDILFTHWPIDNHPDHRVNALLAYDAWTWAGKKFQLVYYEVSNGEDTLYFSPTHYIDITGYEAQKRAACFAHASQAPEMFYALQEQVCRFRGIESGHRFAEAFICPPQPLNLPLIP